MSRYIDADKIPFVVGQTQPSELDYVRRYVIDNMPTADVVEVVRCKDCRFHENEEIGMVYCPAVVGGWVEDNWFCKGGERKNE